MNGAVEAITDALRECDETFALRLAADLFTNLLVLPPDTLVGEIADLHLDLSPRVEYLLEELDAARERG